MNSSTKNIFFTLALPALIITQTAHGMELPGHELSIYLMRLPLEIQAHILGYVTDKNAGWYITTNSKYTNQDTSETKRKHLANDHHQRIDKIDIAIRSSINNTDIYTTIASFDLSTKVVPAQGKTNFYDYCEKQAPKRSYHGFYANDTKIVLSTISSNFPIDKFTNTIDKFTYYQERTIDQLLFKQIIKMGLTVKQPSKKITSIDSLLTEIASLFKGNALVLSAAWKRLPSELQEDLWSNAQQFIQNHGKKDLVAEITKINNYKLTDDSYVPETIININSLATQNKQLIIIHNNEQIPFDSFKTIFFDKDNQLLTIKPGEVNNYMLTPLTIHVPTSPAITKKKDGPQNTKKKKINF